MRGHGLFTGLYGLLGRRCPLLPRLYRQRAVCERESVPFQSKVDMAGEEIQRFEPVPGTHTPLRVAAWYHWRQVRKAGQGRGWDVSGGLKSNRKRRLIAEDGSRPWLTLAEYAATVQPEDWQQATWPAQPGGHAVYLHAVRTWVRKLGPTLVLLTRLSLDEPLDRARYWGSTLVDADAQTVIHVLAIRWDVEVMCEDYKDLLGSDHYQMMSATAVVRFWTLVSCRAYFLDEHRARLQEERPGVHSTLGDARRELRAEHRLNRLLWLEEQYRSGATAQNLYALLNP